MKCKTGGFKAGICRYLQVFALWRFVGAAPSKAGVGQDAPRFYADFGLMVAGR
jgi:hypothetical protein